MLVDYVEVAQAPDTAERFSTSFVDDTAGWKRVQLPFAAFARDATQPSGAPDNGLTLSAVHGLSIDLPAGVTYLDAIRVGPVADVVEPGPSAGPGTGPGRAAGCRCRRPAPPRRFLSATGADLRLAWLAALVLVAGVSLVVVRRRRLVWWRPSR